MTTKTNTPAVADLDKLPRSTYENGPGNVPRLPERVVDTLIDSAGVSRLEFGRGGHPIDQTANVERLVHDTCEELLARLPVATPAAEQSADMAADFDTYWNDPTRAGHTFGYQNTKEGIWNAIRAQSKLAWDAAIAASRRTAGDALDALKAIRDLAAFDSNSAAYYRKAENALAAIECRDATPAPVSAGEAGKMAMLDPSQVQTIADRIKNTVGLPATESAAAPAELIADLKRWADGDLPISLRNVVLAETIQYLTSPAAKGANKP